MNVGQKRIGIDIMGVILPKSVEKASFEEFIACPALPAAFGSIESLVKMYASKNVFIISKCPDFAEKGLMQWFDDHKFFNQTGFLRDNIYFCREQSDKALIAKHLDLTYFIDDKISILEYMEGIVPNRIQLCIDAENLVNTEDINTLPDWPSVLKLIYKL